MLNKKPLNVALFSGLALVLALVCVSVLVTWIGSSDKAPQSNAIQKIQDYLASDESAKEYSWNQKMTLSVETDDGVFEGSSVVRVTWTANTPRINDAAWIPSIKGEMPFVTLDEERHIFALMRNRLDNITERALISADGSVEEHELAKITSATVFSKEVCRCEEKMPHTIEFTDLTDPSTISFSQIEKTCVEISLTDQPVSSSKTVASKLPWLDELRDGAESKTPYTTGETNEIGGPISYHISRRHFLRD